MSEASYPKCPECERELQRVRRPSGSMLNEDQFDAVRAGDWFCTYHTNGRGNTAYAYYWDSEVSPTAPPEPRSVEENVALPPLELVREIEKHRKELIFEVQHWKNEAETLRQAALMEALKAVENERLERHEALIAGYREPDEQGGDECYSQAIHDAEEAIKALLTPSPKSEPTETI